MDIDLRLLVPRDIRLILSETETVSLPGEVSVKRAMLIEQIRGELWAAERERETAQSREEEAECRRLIAKAYEEGANEIHALALERDPSVAPLELTGTQIQAVLASLVAPAQRETLMAQAYASALGLEVPDLDTDPTVAGSPESSSDSDEPEASPPPTGTTSRGASGSPSARTRSARSSKGSTRK